MVLSEGDVHKPGMDHPAGGIETGQLHPVYRESERVGMMRGYAGVIRPDGGGALAAPRNSSPGHGSLGNSVDARSAAPAAGIQYRADCAGGEMRCDRQKYFPRLACVRKQRVRPFHPGNFPEGPDEAPVFDRGGNRYPLAGLQAKKRGP
jgi:hypothetical protein